MKKTALLFMAISFLGAFGFHEVLGQDLTS